MNPYLHIEDVTVSYNRVPALHHLHLDIPCRSCVALLGPNGAGKTTLLKTIAGLLKTETGTISFLPSSKGKSTPNIAYVPQREAIDWDFPITVRGLVEMGRFPSLGLFRPFRFEDAGIVQEALTRMDLTEFADRQIQQLSGGQQQRAFLARAWAQQADIYLLDEPFTGLDRNATDTLRECFHGIRDSGKILIASHHDLASVPDIFDRVVILNGELVAEGPLDEAFTEENIHRAYGTRIFSGVRHQHHNHA